MAVANTITYTMPRGPGPQPDRYESTTILVHRKALTYRGAERILAKRMGLAPKRETRGRGVIVTRIETASVK